MILEAANAWMSLQGELDADAEVGRTVDRQARTQGKGGRALGPIARLSWHASSRRQCVRIAAVE
jgi:hypothetical protein